MRTLKQLFVLATLTLFFIVGSNPILAKANANDQQYAWHTFYGSSDSDWGYDWAYATAVDKDGNVYVAGLSFDNWLGDGGASPLHPVTGDEDIAIVKLDSHGTYQWHTFYGSTDRDEAYGITTDASGNVYVTGSSPASWQGDNNTNPLHAHNSAGEVFVLKLSGAGAYQWHTFYGGNGQDRGVGIGVEGTNIVVTGESEFTWQGDGNTNPIHPLDVRSDLLVMKLSTSGVYQWHTFYGSPNDIDFTTGDPGQCIVVDSNHNVYVAGQSYFSWLGDNGMNPLHPYTGDSDLSILKLDQDGVYQWHTFYGSAGYERGLGIDVDQNNTVYVSGDSGAPWQGDNNTNPLNPHSGAGNMDQYVIKLDSNGVYQWHTFDAYGGGSDSVTLAVRGAVYVAGGKSLVTFTRDGAYQTHILFAPDNAPTAVQAIAADNFGNVYVAGYSQGGWLGIGNVPPLHAYGGSTDMFVVKFSQHALAAPALIRPINKAKLAKVWQMLDWTDVSDATNYHIQLCQNDRKGILIAKTNVIDSQFRTPPLERGKKYVWRVRACNELGCGDWTRWWKFEIKGR